MVDYTWPDDLAPFRVTYYLQAHVGGQESPLTRTRKVYGLSAPRWVCRMSFRGGYDGSSGVGAFGPRLDALIAQMEGGLNRVAIWDFRRPQPIVPQYHQSGETLSTTGGTAGDTSMVITGFSPYAVAFSVGDYIGGDGRAHIVTEAVLADGDGEATVAFKPPLSSDVSAGAAVVQKVASWFRLTSEDAGDNDTEVGQLSGYQLEFVEDLA